VSRIECQRDGPFAALRIGGAASLGMIVSTENGRVKLEEMSIGLEAAGVGIFIAMTM
jgi:hypothetical protein